MVGYGKRSFENKAICTSLDERSAARRNRMARRAKNDDGCRGIKPACTLTPIMILDLLSLFASLGKTRVAPTGLMLQFTSARMGMRVPSGLTKLRRPICQRNICFINVETVFLQ